MVLLARNRDPLEYRGAHVLTHKNNIALPASFEQYGIITRVTPASRDQIFQQILEIHL